MIEDVAMEEELTANERVAEVHQEIERTGDAFASASGAMWNEEAVGPERVSDGDTVDLLHQEVQLVNVKVVHLLGDVHHVPLFNRTDVDDEHRLGLRRVGFAV